ncbi:MAG: TrmH family RNA methyltransferase [Nitriliruptoraceae bacterium]
MLTSTRNPRVRAARGLHRSRERRTTGRHLVEGPRAVQEALAAGVVEELYLVADDAVALQASWQLTPEPDGNPVRVEHVTTEVLAAMCDATTPQGVVAVARTEPASLAQVPDGVVVVLDRVADPGNAGTVLRTADALGAAAVVLTQGSVDAYAPKTVRAAVGSTYHLPVVTGVAFSEVAAHARATGRRLVGLDAHGEVGLDLLRSAAGAVTLVLGNEAHGLDPASRDLLAAVVAIELEPRAESLNVAAAAAIAIHAATRG